VDVDAVVINSRAYLIESVGNNELHKSSVTSVEHHREPLFLPVWTSLHMPSRTECCDSNITEFIPSFALSSHGSDIGRSSELRLSSQNPKRTTVQFQDLNTIAGITGNEADRCLLAASSSGAIRGWSPSCSLVLSFPFPLLPCFL
jgi:hypothetical protein